MKTVIDTNVFVSGIFWNGPPFKILKAWKHGIIDLVLTESILAEYNRVIDILTKEYPPINLTSFIELVTVKAEFCQSIDLPSPVSPDPDDDKFIACALVSGAKIIVSGDKDLLQVSGYQEVTVLKPKAFIDKYLS